jgi:hypothetical protein
LGQGAPCPMGVCGRQEEGPPSQTQPSAPTLSGASHPQVQEGKGGGKNQPCLSAGPSAGPPTLWSSQLLRAVSNPAWLGCQREGSGSVAPSSAVVPSSVGRRLVVISGPTCPVLLTGQGPPVCLRALRTAHWVALVAHPLVCGCTRGCLGSPGYTTHPCMDFTWSWMEQPDRGQPWRWVICKPCVGSGYCMVHPTSPPTSFQQEVGHPVPLCEAHLLHFHKIIHHVRTRST